MEKISLRLRCEIMWPVVREISISTGLCLFQIFLLAVENQIMSIYEKIVRLAIVENSMNTTNYEDFLKICLSEVFRDQNWKIIC